MTDYEWRACEANLNALPQFITEIDGLDIHFIHVRSQHEQALPLIVNHGWPGSFIELLKIIGLTDHAGAWRERSGRESCGGDSVDAELRVLGEADEQRLGPERMGRAWAELMKRLGYRRYVAQGGDWGGFVVDQMGSQAPARLLAKCARPPPPRRSPGWLKAFSVRRRAARDLT